MDLARVKFIFCLCTLCGTLVFFLLTLHNHPLVRRYMVGVTYSAFPESALAHALLDGLSGVEIGASAHNPFGLRTINVDYTNSTDIIFKRAELHMSGTSVRIDVVAEGDSLPFAENSYDFVLSSHVLEHFFDPIAAVEEWLRVVKPGGFVYMVIPHRDRVRDRDRELTTLEELTRRHRSGRRVWVAQEESLEKRTHHSFWTPETFMQLCRHQGWRVLASQGQDDKVGNGFTIVLQKSYCAST